MSIPAKHNQKFPAYMYAVNLLGIGRVLEFSGVDMLLKPATHCYHYYRAMHISNSPF